MREGEPDERSAKVETFIKRLVASDGDLLPVTGNEFILRTIIDRPKRKAVDHCLTLLGQGINDDGLLNPFGWIGLRIAENDGIVKALLAGTKLSLLRFPKSEFTTPNLEYDPEERIVRLKNGNWFFAGTLGDVFDCITPAMRVDSFLRNQGWGRFLVQAAAQIALDKGSQILGCEQDTYDTTISASKTRQSLYSRALGAEKEFTPTGGWFYQIGPQTPVDQIAAFLL